jgi:hypothetical protein
LEKEGFEREGFERERFEALLFYAFNMKIKIMKRQVRWTIM